MLYCCWPIYVDTDKQGRSRQELYVLFYLMFSQLFVPFDTKENKGRGWRQCVCLCTYTGIMDGRWSTREDGGVGNSRSLWNRREIKNNKNKKKHSLCHGHKGVTFSFFSLFCIHIFIYLQTSIITVSPSQPNTHYLLTYTTTTTLPFAFLVIRGQTFTYTTC